MMNTSARADEGEIDKREEADVEKLSLQQSVLLNVVESDYGLLDEIFTAGLVNRQQIDEIKSNQTRNGRVGRLLDLVNRMSSVQKEKFLSALDKTQQPHVTNFIRRNGERPTDSDVDNWPIYPYSTQWTRIEQNWSQLIELIDAYNGLLDEMLTVACINNRQKQAVLKWTVDAERNEQLLNILQRKSIKDYQKFTSCLRKTKQHHVVSLLDPDCAANSQPLLPELKSSIVNNYSTLMDVIECNTKFIASLYSKQCITKRQKEFIETPSLPSESNRRLLDIVMRGSQSDYSAFIECLNETGQYLAKEILTESDGIIVQVTAKTNGSDNLSEYETQLVDEFNSTMSSISPDKRKIMFAKVKEHFEKVELDNDVRLVAMQTAHSIKLFFLCKSLPALLHLRELYTTGELVTIVQQIFDALLGQAQFVTVDTLAWELPNYYQCVEFLSSAIGMAYYSHLHHLAQQSPSDVNTKPNSSSLEIDRLPHELIEMLLMKAAGQLFVIVNEKTSQAVIYTLTTLSAVSRYWWETVHSRLAIRQLLRQYFTSVCHPYRVSPRLVTNLQTTGGIVAGVAEFNKSLYVASVKSNLIQVFTVVGSNENQHQRDIKVPDMVRPRDLVACSVTGCLYITDSDTCSVLRINLATDDTSRFIATPYVPRKISVQSSRLVVAPHTGDAVFVYGRDGQLIKTIQLPDYMVMYHAAETPHGTFIISHRLKYVEDSNPDHKAAVTELSADGKVLRVYKGVIQLNECCYLTVDADKHILVADQRNKRILHLNSELKLKQVLLTAKPTQQPWQLCYNENTGQLIICFYNSQDISIYKIKVASKL